MIFYVCVLFAGMSSLVNLYEAPVETLQERCGLKRPVAVAVIAAAGCSVALFIQALSLGGWMWYRSISVRLEQCLPELCSSGCRNGLCPGGCKSRCRKENWPKLCVARQICTGSGGFSGAGCRSAAWWNWLRYRRTGTFSVEDYEKGCPCDSFTGQSFCAIIRFSGIKK